MIHIHNVKGVDRWGLGGALAPPLFELYLILKYMGMLKLDEILVVFTVVIVG